jgi:hypothetical protein
MSDLEVEEAPAQTLGVDSTCSESPAVTSEPVWQPSHGSISGARTGVLAGFANDGRTPLVVLRGHRSTAAVPARMTMDLHGAHVGREVLLVFENGDPRHPIIIGCLSTGAAWPEAERPVQVEVDADGERLVVTAKSQLVLRCGKASITLTSAGKVLIQGAYVSSRSSGVNRVKGGSVQIN